jgi:hypothetical protein
MIHGGSPSAAAAEEDVDDAEDRNNLRRSES